MSTIRVAYYRARGCLKSWLLFRHPHELKIKSLYINDLIFNIAKKPKETVQKLKVFGQPHRFCVICPPS